MIFKTRTAFNEAVMKEVCKEQERIRIDRRLFELEEEVRKLRWKVEQLEALRNPTPAVTPIVTWETGQTQ